MAGSATEELLASLRAEPEASAILCDVDGTLAPIVDDPEAASVPEDTRSLLRELASRYALVGCLTGRRALDARRIVGVTEIAYAGNHGFETLAPGSDEPQSDPAVAERADLTRRFVEGLEGERLRALDMRSEDKGAIQALHWRGAADEDAAQACAEEVAEMASAAGLVPRWGRKVLEIRPIDGIDKGSAARRMLDDAGVANALFGGDDRTDLDAFGALRAMTEASRLRTAVCVGVASDEQPEGLAERADILVEGTEGFREVLERLV
jgi:trehalose 6-phosphate phosphatase